MNYQRRYQLRMKSSQHSSSTAGSWTYRVNSLLFDSLEFDQLQITDVKDVDSKNKKTLKGALLTKLLEKKTFKTLNKKGSLTM